MLWEEPTLISTSARCLNLAPKPRAFAILLALLLISLVLVIILGFLGVRGLEYSSSSRIQQMALAQSLAEAGMEDARVKLEKDMFFPPLGGYGQTSFIFSEDVTDPDNGLVIGSYTVTVDFALRGSPFNLIKVQCIGAAGLRINPRARYRIYAEVDASSYERASNSFPNPHLFRYMLWREGDVEQPANIPLPE